ncbi:MAG TPA: hypothetical protein VJC05_04315 [Candidatus Andersenbacteria bacterium]|nr:hypothetical protein [Candidatus Andersenbacteria bacterium]
MEKKRRAQPGCGAGPFTNEEAFQQNMPCKCGLILTRIDPKHNKGLFETMLAEVNARQTVQSGS